MAGEISDSATIALDIPLTKDYGGGTYRVLKRPACMRSCRVAAEHGVT